MRRIERKEYLSWLIRWRGRQIIKVVSGVRRCGKSTMFDIFRDYLLLNGVSKEQIISINFEDIEYEPLTNYRALYEYIKPLLLADKMCYVFLDEIQHVEKFEKAVDSLLLRPNCDVYITGSNAYFMSGELATLLSGRYVELKMLPLGFGEFCGALGDNPSLSTGAKFELYTQTSSFPHIVQYINSGREVREYLRDIYNTVLLNDIISRLKITDVNSLENITKFLLHNIGSRVSPKKISDTLKSSGHSVDQKTVDKYIRGLTDSLMLYEAARYNIKGRQYLTTQSKYYAVDIGLRNMLTRGKEGDEGHILENIVFLELKRRGYEVFVGQLDDGEVDFAALDDKGAMSYYQVSLSTLSEATLERELAPLKKIADNYPKYLLTLDEVFAQADYNGIQKLNALGWLLDVRPA